VDLLDSLVRLTLSNYRVRAFASKLNLIVVDFATAGMINALAMNSSSAGRSRQVMSLDFS